jgi:hypothetical protein
MDWFRTITQTHTTTPYEDTSPDNSQETADTPDTPPKTSWFSFSSWNIETTLLELLFTYNKSCIQFKQYIQTMNDKYVAVQYITCAIQSLSLFCGVVFRYLFFADTIPEKCEPDENWVNIVRLYRIPEDHNDDCPTTHEHFLDTNPDEKSSGARYYIEETYQTYDYAELDDKTDEFNDPAYIRPMELAGMYYSQACSTANRAVKQEANIVEIIVWSRDTQRDEQVLSLWSSSKRPLYPLLQQDIIYSSVVFLNIEYRHPKMGDTVIEISLPKQIMIAGNVLLSPAFLYRWLKYFSNVPFVFDDAYCVYLMDDNVNQHILRYGDYIVLGKTDIQIVKHFSHNDCAIHEIEETKTSEPSE